MSVFLRSVLCRFRFPTIAICLLGTLVLLAATVCCRLESQTHAAGQKAEKKKGVYEVKQGGYVEKIDPNIDYKDRLPRIAPMKPAESMKTFHIIPGFRMEQVAAEPLVRDVVDLVFDENGRMYVAELITYAEKQQKGGIVTNTSRVSVLEDVNNDGKFDKSTVFVDSLSWPTGLLPFDGGLFVATTPDVIYCKDTDGDGKADVREVIITGFAPSNPNACPNSLRWGLDSRVQGMTSTSGGALQAVKWEKGGEGRKAKLVQSRGRDFSFHPRTGELRLEGGGSQFGMTFDQWGRKFESSNSAPIEMVMYDERYIARNPYLAAPSARIRIWTYGSTVYRTSRVEPWRALRTELRIKGTFSGPVEGGGTPAGYFTGACGVHVYKGDAFPKELSGNAFVAEGSGNLVHRMQLKPDGVTLKAYRTEEKKEFLTSDEIWFRPIQFINAPDGTLYLADMYREIYEHPDAVPASARMHLDLLAGQDRGRVYRIVPDGFRQPPPVRLGGKSTAELVKLLEHSNGWHRNTASRLLFERQDPKAIEPIEQLAAESSSALGRMHALYALAGQQALTANLVRARLDDPEPRVREHAVLLSETLLADEPALRAKLYEMTGDDDMRVRYQLAFTLGEIPGSQATAALAAITGRDVSDRWVRLAILSSTFGRTGELFSRLADDGKWCGQKSARAFLEQLAEQAGLQKRSDQVVEFFKWLESNAGKDKTLAQSVVRGLSKGLAKAKSPLLARLQSGGSGGLLAEMIQQAKMQAADPEQSVERRTQAIRSLATASFDVASDALEELLDSRQPPPVQSAALQTLSRFNDEAVAPMIVDGWHGFSPSVRLEASEALFARSERLSVLLSALEDEEISPSQLDPTRIQFLLSHPDEKIKSEATRLLGGVKLARREEVVAAYQEALKLKGDVGRGREMFRKECSICHKLEDTGFDLGLPLSSVKNRGPETILLSVLDPNREVLPPYLGYAVITEEGRMMTGMITAETATSITLTRAEGEHDTVLRGDIDELLCTDLSMMPEGLEEQLNQQQMADVIAYLMAVQ